MTTPDDRDTIHEGINKALLLSTLEAIRIAVFHGTGMVIQLDGKVQTIRPEEHPLYEQAMRKHARTGVYPTFP